MRDRLIHFHRVVSGQLGGADLALDLITPTAEREQVLDFSEPYLDAAPTVMVRSGTAVPDLATAQGLRWGAVRATTFVGIIDDSIAPDRPPRIYDNTAEMLAASRSDEIDAALLDMPLAVATAAALGRPPAAVAQLPDRRRIAAALPKGSSNGEAVDSAMRAFTADGTIHRPARALGRARRRPTPSHRSRCCEHDDDGRTCPLSIAGDLGQVPDRTGLGVPGPVPGRDHRAAAAPASARCRASSGCCWAAS